MRIGFSEVVLLLIIALVIFGPSKLPELGESLGLAFREFRDAASDKKDTSKDHDKSDNNENKDE